MLRALDLDIENVGNSETSILKKITKTYQMVSITIEIVAAITLISVALILWHKYPAELGKWARVSLAVGRGLFFIILGRDIIGII